LSSTADSINYSNISISTLYRAFVKNGTCSVDTSNIISIDIFPKSVITSNDTTIDLGNNAIISASGGVIYSWSPSSSLTSPNNATTIATPLSSTNYIVTIIDLYGCTYFDSVMVSVNIPIIEDTGIISSITIADLITANGDGLNDTWNIIGIEDYPNSKAMVFNTSGNLVYESNNYNNDWKGTWNGNQLPDGTYYYIVEITGETDIRKGFLTIVSQ
ncbi:MAG: gliding motility-associated C-terminal domain-containing protein, partial [Flavobacteriales bacterium]